MLDAVGLDNDGDGVADYPADSDCSAPATPTATPTPGYQLRDGSRPRLHRSGEGQPARGREEARQGEAEGQAHQAAADRDAGPVRRPGQRQHRVRGLHLRRRQPAEGRATRSRAPEQICGDSRAGRRFPTRATSTATRSATADGILKMKLIGGDAGKGKVKVIGKNTTGNLPTGVSRPCCRTRPARRSRS